MNPVDYGTQLSKMRSDYQESNKKSRESQKKETADMQENYNYKTKKIQNNYNENKFYQNLSKWCPKDTTIYYFSGAKMNNKSDYQPKAGNFGSNNCTNGYYNNPTFLKI